MRLEEMIRMVIGSTVCLVLAIGLSAVAQDAGASKSLIDNEKVRVNSRQVPGGGTIAADPEYDILLIRIGETNVAAAALAKEPTAWARSLRYLPARSKKRVSNPDTNAVNYVQVLFLHAPGKYVAFDIPVTHYCNPGSKTACVDEKYLFCTDLFCVEAVTLGPGAISTQHTHQSDHIVIATDNFRWRDEITGGSAAEHTFKVGDVMYVKAGVTHRLINVGKTTATLVAVQFK